MCKEEAERLRLESIDARRLAREQRYEEELASRMHKEEIKIRNDFHRRADDAAQAAADVHARHDCAQEKVSFARDDAMAEADAARRAKGLQDSAEKDAMLASHQAARAKSKASRLASRCEEMGGRQPVSRSAEERAALNPGARRKRRRVSET